MSCSQNVGVVCENKVLVTAPGPSPSKIVIKDSDHPVPAVMYEQFELQGVSIVLEVTIPSLETADYTDLKPLDSVAEQIFNAGTRVIYTYTFSPNDIYLYLEAMR